MNEKASPPLEARFENIRYLALDMDGTLLPDDKKIPDFTLGVLRDARAAGYRLCICSGRSFAGVYKYEPLRDIISYYVCFEGGYIVDNSAPTSPKVIYKRRIPSAAAAAVARACEKSGAMLALLTGDEGYCLDCDEDIFNSVRIWGAVPIVSEYRQLYTALGERDIYIALVYGGRGQIDSVWDDFSKACPAGCDAIDTYLDFKDLHHLVIKAPGVNKWNGIARVLEMNGFTADNLIAFGDWHNDFEMIKNAGVGVAMKNAEAAIIEAALLITSHDNNDEGVARFIREKLLGIVG